MKEDGRCKTSCMTEPSGKSVMMIICSNSKKETIGIKKIGDCSFKR